MTARVRMQVNGREIDRTYTGGDCDEIVENMQKDVSSESPWIIRLAIGKMTPLQFAREAVKKYNASNNTSHPTPTSCSHFLELGAIMGIVQISEK